MDVKRAVEAVLFHSSDPVSVKELAKSLRRRVEEINAAVEELINEYTGRNSALEVVKIGEKVVMRVKPEYMKYVENLVERYLDRGTLRTLAVIAAKQPITLSKLAKIRGNKCYNHVKKLKELGFVKAEKVEGKRSAVLTTTKDFATYFGLKSNDPEEVKRAIREYLKGQRDVLEYG